MKCPNDQTEMEEGKTETMAGMPLRFKKKDAEATVGISGEEIIAYKCPKCSLVQFQSKVS